MPGAGLGKRKSRCLGVTSKPLRRGTEAPAVLTFRRPGGGGRGKKEEEEDGEEGEGEAKKKRL